MFRAPRNVKLSPLLGRSITFYTITAGVKSCLIGSFVFSQCLDHSSIEESFKSSKWPLWRQPKADPGVASSQSLTPAATLSMKARNDLLVHDLSRLSQRQELLLSVKDHQRTDDLKDRFHDKFVTVLKEEIQKRPYVPDETHCKARCEEEPAFREGYQEGISMSLAILGQSIRAFHQEALSENYEDERCYQGWAGLPDFKITKIGQDMLDSKLGTSRADFFT